MTESEERPAAGEDALPAATARWALPGGARERAALAALLVVYFVLGGLYLATVPFGHAPDEGSHLRYVRDLAAGRIPVLRMEDRAGFEAHQPPLAYVLALPAYLAAGGRAEPEPGRAPRYAVRLVSLLLGGLVVVLVWWGVRLWLPWDPAVALGAAAVAALMPMRLAVAASFSNDPLTEVVFCAVLLALMAGLRAGFDRRRCLVVGGILGLGLLTKASCALLLPVALVAVFMEWRRHRTRECEYGVNALLMLAVALTISGPWLARNTVLYGDPMAARVFDEFFSDRVGPEYFMTRQGLSFAQYLQYRVLPFTARSFWGVFDHMSLWMGGPVDPPLPGMRPDLAKRGTPDAPIYTFLEWVLYLLMAGLVATCVSYPRLKPGVSEGGRRSEAWQRDAALVGLFCFLMVASAYARFNLTYFQPQARYLYAAVLPIAAAVSLGWLAPWPMRARMAGAALGGALLAALALYAWQGTLLRVFGKVGW